MIVAVLIMINNEIDESTSGAVSASSTISSLVNSVTHSITSHSNINRREVYLLQQ